MKLFVVLTLCFVAYILIALREVRREEQREKEKEEEKMKHKEKKKVKEVRRIRHSCEVCGRMLHQDSSNQVVRFCSKACRKMRHNKKKGRG